MSARDAILQAVRAARPAPTPLPDVPATAATFARPADLTARFVEAARAGGSRVVEGTRTEAARLVTEGLPELRRVASSVPGIAGTTPIPETPHGFADVDLFVCEAVLGVAESGAAWLPGSRLGAHRAGLFLAHHVAVLLQRSAIVADLHAAYAGLDVAGEPFGVFVAGPSKTADIEQSLVVGAHGPKSLTIMLLDQA